MARKLFLLSFLILYCWRCEISASRSRRQQLYPPPIIYPMGGTFKGSLPKLASVQPIQQGKTPCMHFFWRPIAPPLQQMCNIRNRVPVKLSGRILIYGQNFQFQYALPQNATFFTEFFATSSRRRRKSVGWNERMTVYRLLEDEFERRGINGRECMKKSICEAAVTPLDGEGLVGELLHLLLTPRKSDTPLDSEYLQALEFGREYHDCSLIYKLCLPGQGILDQISKIMY